MRISSWIKHLRKRRGNQFIRQMLRMWNFHRTSFGDILNNIIDALHPYDAKFTFPTVASVALTRPQYIREILRHRHEVASHGYKHVKYPFLSPKEQDLEFQLAHNIFQKMNIPIRGFRAPYNNYNDETLHLVEKYGFDWDGGIGYRLENRERTGFFATKNGETQFSFTCIPLNRHTDDLLIDSYHLNNDQITKILNNEIRKVVKSGGVLMFDLHPIRIGQQQYVSVLSNIVDYAHQFDGWLPTVSDALDYWNKNKEWKHNAKFCLLLTGDIDNFTFFDYLRRLT
ncbi:MAG: polysaccharide deacetylase family protein [Candidatus Kariarchaeaceae archaeon]